MTPHLFSRRGHFATRRGTRFLLTLAVLVSAIACGEPQSMEGRMAYPEELAESAPVPPRQPHQRDRQWADAPEHNTERYRHLAENDFQLVADHPLSTFSIDVDSASYSNVRRFLERGQRPPVDAVRIEELINYFQYDYPQPEGADPFSVTSEVAPAPWNEDHLLVHIGLQGKELSPRDIPGRNLVFLLDVSGSMNADNKLGLLKRSMGLLVDELDEQDRVAIVVYAGASGVVLEPTEGDDRDEIMDALDDLEAGGSTNGAAGIELAYQLAEDSFVRGGVNRVILATDGDFNVGVTDEGSLVRLIERKRERGVFLTVLGFGMGNLNDSMMEQLADHGNGNYAYIDTIREAKKVLVDEASSTLVTIAKDTKIQVEFNPSHVAAYRLIGYENRMLRDEDFEDDRKDAGDLGAGHSVTAIYEVVPATSAETTEGSRRVPALRYQSERRLQDAAGSNELMTVSLRYKEPEGSRSRLLTKTVGTQPSALSDTTDAFRFAVSVAAFGMLLRQSDHIEGGSWDMVRSLARGAMGADRFGYRSEFVDLVRAARRLE